MRRARYLGITYLLLALFVLWFFGLGSRGQGSAAFGLARPTDTFNWIPDLSVPGGGVRHRGGGGPGLPGRGAAGPRLRQVAEPHAGHRLRPVHLRLPGLGGGAASRSTWWACCAPQWSGARRSPSGRCAGMLGERVAVINIAIEGQLLAGAFMGALVGVPHRQRLAGGGGGHRHRPAARLGAGGAGHPLQGGPDHHRRGHQHLRAGADLVPDHPHPGHQPPPQPGAARCGRGASPAWATSRSSGRSSSTRRSSSTPR